MNWNDCKKCPENNCNNKSENDTNKVLFSNELFFILPPCADYDDSIRYVSFSLCDSGFFQLVSYHNMVRAEYVCDTIEDMVNYIVDNHNLQLLDYLYLLKLKATL